MEIGAPSRGETWSRARPPRDCRVFVIDRCLRGCLHGESRVEASGGVWIRAGGRAPQRPPASVPPGVAKGRDHGRAHGGRGAATAAPWTAHRTAAAGPHVRSRTVRPRRRPGGRAAPRLDLHRRPQLGPELRPARPPLPGHRARPPRARARPAGRTPFRLEDCADDVAALLDVLGVERCIAVGYSMGGPIAQLLWRRHPELVDGLVLCATSARFNGTPRERLLSGLATGGSIVAGAVPVRSISRAALLMSRGWRDVRGAGRGRSTRWRGTTGRTSSRPGGRSAASTPVTGWTRSTSRAP